jgi:putative tryptophan/tyrosine transport system substrate-binding protein
MRRRDFIQGTAISAVAWPLAVRAEPQGMRRIGFVSGSTRPALFELSPYAGFLQGMRELGYTEGQDFVIEWRFAEGRYELFPEFANEFARLRIDVIVTGLTSAVRAMRQANPDTPIVMGYSVDPVGLGLVDSLARPGGNTTGLTSAQDDIVAKQMDLPITAVPNLTRIAVLTNPAQPYEPLLVEIVQRAARQARTALVSVKASTADEIVSAFDAFTKERAEAVIVSVDALFMMHRQQIAELALRSRLPSIFGNREYTEAGGLMSYGESLRDFYRRAATFVDKIFRGSKPMDLPVEQPTKFTFVINRKTAKALGLDIPDRLLSLADEVIE